MLIWAILIQYNSCRMALKTLLQHHIKLTCLMVRFCLNPVSKWVLASLSVLEISWKPSTLKQSFMGTVDNLSGLSFCFFFLGAVIKFPNDRSNIMEEDWTLSGIEVQTSKTPVMKLIHLKYTAWHRAVLSCNLVAKWLDNNKKWCTVMYVAAAIIQFNMKPGADHKDATHVF